MHQLAPTRLVTHRQPSTFTQFALLYSHAQHHIGAIGFMAHTFTLTDDQYADASRRTPEGHFLAWAMDEEARYRLAHPTYHETDDWLRHLGVSDERIHRANETDTILLSAATAEGLRVENPNAYP